MATGELLIFNELWEEQEHKSQVSGEILPCKENSLWIWCFSHLLPKGLYGKARLSKENIWLLLPAEHHILDHYPQVIKDKKEWQALFAEKERLKILYHEGYFDKC